MLFPAVRMNFPNSKVCLIGEWSIDIGNGEYQFIPTGLHMLVFSNVLSEKSVLVFMVLL